jgi:hypothetical protein
MPKSRSDARLRGWIFAAGLAVALAGCAAKPKPYAAATTPPPADPAMQQAQVECAKLATSQTATITQQDQASKAAVGLYYKCMATKGYPEPTSKPAP